MKRKTTVLIVLAVVAIAALSSPYGRFVLRHAGVNVYIDDFITDETITSGSAYGFDMGMTKVEVIEQLKVIHPKDISFDFRLMETGRISPREQLTYTPEQVTRLQGIDDWRLYFNDKRSDYVELTFSNDNRLIQINRFLRRYEVW